MQSHLGSHFQIYPDSEFRGGAMFGLALDIEKQGLQQQTGVLCSMLQEQREVIRSTDKVHEQQRTRQP